MPCTEIVLMKLSHFFLPFVFTDFIKEINLEGEISSEIIKKK